MPVYNIEYRGIEEVVFVAYFNKPSSLPGFLAEFLWSNFLAACLDVGRQLCSGLRQLLELARLPPIERRTVFRHVITI